MGTRLRPVVHDRPKVMALVDGRPFVTILLDQLAAAGLHKVVLCTGYMAPVIRQELGDSYRNLELVYSVEERPLGTGGALRLACEQFPAGLLLVLNGDSYCDCPLSAFVAGLEASNAASGMVLAKVDDVSRFGAVHTGQDSLIERFVEKGGEPAPGWINAGIYLLPGRRLMELPPQVPISLEREVIPRLIATGLYGHRCSGTFIDIGVPAEFQRAQRLFSETEKYIP